MRRSGALACSVPPMFLLRQASAQSFEINFQSLRPPEGLHLRGVRYHLRDNGRRIRYSDIR
jgi:hypothetical protein